MKFQGITSNFAEANAEALALVVFKNEKPTAEPIKTFDKLTGGVISELMKSGEFKAEPGDTALIHIASKGKTKATKLLLLGAGEKDEYKRSCSEKSAGTAVRCLRGMGVKTVAFSSRVEAPAMEAAAAAAQGAVTSQFELDKYKTVDKNNKEVTTFIIHVENAKPAELKSGIAKGESVGESINFTRDLANEPPNILTPTEMAKRAQDMAKATGLKCEILDEAKMIKMGMGSLMSVSIGSEQPAKMIVLKYTPAKSTAKKGDLIALVGKGITFDTGGISIKPSEGMEAMKYDMSGGATVLGTMRAIALTKPSVPVLGIVAAVENMPDGKATRPSDVVTAMNGKTVEVLNTDAEGRLILADAVAYAEKLGATTIIDMATLTGAVIVALGSENTGIMGNDQELVDKIIETGKANDEGFWQLPLGKEYSKQIKSDIADIKNIGPRGRAGTIMGAVFIQEFIDKAKWAHLDIAGTAWSDSSKPYSSKGPTGVAVRTLLNFVENA